MIIKPSSGNLQDEALGVLTHVENAPAAQRIESLTGTHRLLAVSSVGVRFWAAFGAIAAALFLLLPAAFSASRDQGMRHKGVPALHAGYVAIPVWGAAPAKAGYGGPAGPSDKPQGKKAKPGAASGFGQLVVISNPPGAKIKLDGQSDPAWITPCTIAKLQPGAHVVTVSKELYATWEEQVEVHGGQKELRVELVGLGEVDILTIPAEAEVVIDGRSYGPSPVRASLKEGLHTYEVRFAGMPPYEKSVLLKGGARISTRVTLGALAAAQRGMSAQAATSKSGVTGHILRLRGDIIAVDLGSKQGLRTGSRLAVYKANNSNVQVGELEITQVLSAEESEARIVNMKPGFKLELSDLLRLQ